MADRIRKVLKFPLLSHSSIEFIKQVEGNVNKDGEKNIVYYLRFKLPYEVAMNEMPFKKAKITTGKSIFKPGWADAIKKSA